MKQLATICVLAAASFAQIPLCAESRTVYLDPFTMLFQTDDPREGRAISGEEGYWASPNGQVDPLASKPVARIMHNVFRRSAEPFQGYDPAKPSPVFKVNQVGYMPHQRKYCYLGAWLGPKLGAWRPSPTAGGWRVADAKTGETVYRGDGAPLHRVDDFLTKEGTPFTGEYTFEMDFSSVTNEGTYFIVVDGVGRSRDFRIWGGAAEEAFRVHMGGLYQKRCGIAKTEPYTHWTAGACHTNIVRGTFPPEEGDIPKWLRWFDLVREGTEWEQGEKLEVVGGWHDAADYDRRPQHLGIVNDLCAAYAMKPGNFYDGQLSIPENANGIPDVLDEAEWGLRHLLAVQQKDGGVGTWIESVGHPVPGNVAERDGMKYAVSRATRASSLSYAAHAALLARCEPRFKDKYLESAVRAWNFAMQHHPSQETFYIEKRKHRFWVDRHVYEWKEPKTLSAQSLVKAAINLNALTGDSAYLRVLGEKRREIEDDFKKNEWRWSAWVFAAEHAFGTPASAEWFMKSWRSKINNRAKEMLQQVDGAYAYRCPWWAPGKGWCHAMSWGQCHPLRRAQTLVLAYVLNGDAHMLDAACAALDFHNGCNPCGTTLTSGLGEVYPVAFLDLPSYVDGIAEYVPGITPYRWNYGMPPKAIEMVWGGDRKLALKCPIWRRWGNVENQTVGASEYTVWETISPAAATCGYLMEPTRTPPPVRPKPADDLRKLPGYWSIP